jgi:hypothetical protein
MSFRRRRKSFSEVLTARRPWRGPHDHRGCSPATLGDGRTKGVLIERKPYGFVHLPTRQPVRPWRLERLRGELFDPDPMQLVEWWHDEP